jgi:hypothetical protein
MSETWLESTVIVVLFLVGLGFGGYIYLMIFHPEWVGITGESARKTLHEHKEGTEVSDRDENWLK